MLVAIVALCMGCKNDSGSGGNQILSDGTYTLEVTNDSTQFGSVCIYQTIPDQVCQNDNFYLLVWLSKVVYSNIKASFIWDNTDYSFVWSETRKLAPEMKFYASEIKDADPMA